MEACDHVFYRNLRKVYPVADRAEGVYIWDTEGHRYIDGSGGACVVSIGHCVPEILEAMETQFKRVPFVHSSHFTNPAACELGTLLHAMAPDKSLNRTYFLSGGSEAVESAVKLVRQYWREAGRPDKYKVISRWSSFHGNTTGALALGGHTARRSHYLPIFQHTPHIEPAYCYRCGFKETPDTCDLQCADELERCIKHEDPESVGAFIAEPVVGATAGAVVPKDGYWQRIRQICDEYEIKLIADEVMTGIGRCGHNFGIEHWGVVPDLIVMAKGLSSGYTPLGAVMVREEIHATIKNGSGVFVHGHTYGQNPLSTAIGAAVLRYIQAHGLVERSHRMGIHLMEKLATLETLEIVGDIRGMGLFAGIELVRDKTSRAWFERDLKVNMQVANEAFKRGLITYPGNGGVDGIHGDHILLAPPFTISAEQIDEMVDILGEAITAVARTL
ncbi:MAG: aspartate aminotransferase family protein [Desulfobacterales bacterium]|nr:aspartate aminotransferase family protein [Desulfobacterales bacterium]MDJ0873883.1 aspartate aminotransferase family protein [Desulfobacterales bacterium]MDJ0884579.1 aspartate aminotransferase family protein [Desulfobacterales bacterium]